MKEQSHKNEMRAALRGDFERLRARRRNGGEGAGDRSRPEEQAAAAPLAADEVGRPSWLDRLRDRH